MQYTFGVFGGLIGYCPCTASQLVESFSGLYEIFTQQMERNAFFL